jgi:hypothetical protein
MIDRGYRIQTFREFLTAPASKTAVIRHDVDNRKKHALNFAYIEQAMDVSTSYYFRMVPQSFDPVIVSLIARLGHEIGYHYEDLTLAHGNKAEAIRLFEKHLAELRQYYPVKTICMHGSPLSRYDNRDLWKENDYRNFGIIGEPYFDVNYSQVLYLTDTGRTWRNEKVSIRDKVDSHFHFHPRSTHDIIKHIDNFPDKLMFNFHPQRWNDAWIPWINELVLQNVKNVVKRFLVVR